MSYDNTVGLGADTWRHVAFIEQQRPVGRSRRRATCRGGSARATGGLRWLMASDVCKHCTHAACLDVCPTGALMRTEFGTVVVQADVCNGCGYCIPACPYGVIDQRKEDGRAWKCTMCYDRLGAGMEPACAKACPTDSIQFGPLDELRERAPTRLEQLHAAGEDERAAVRARPGRRRGRRRRVLPAARRARGVRAAAGPGGDHAGPAVDVAARRRGGRGARRARRGVVRGGALRSGERLGLGGRALSDDGGARSAGGARRRRARRAERPMVPKAEFTSYYGKPVLNPPVWEARDIAGYFFLGGLAGGSSLLAAGADLTGRPGLSRVGEDRGARARAWCRWPRSCTTWAARRGSST